MRKAENLIGKRFGLLTVIDFVDKTQTRNTRWLCKCDCGNETIKLGCDLVSGHTRSCGCLAQKRFVKYKKYPKKLIRCYHGIKERCNNSNNKNFKNYGGRGIKMSKEWENNIFLFCEWAINNGYNDKLTIERIDVNRGYSEENCKFIPKSEQSENRRNTHWISYNNEIHSLSYWSKKFNTGRKLIYYYLQKGYSFEDYLKLKNLV